mgnify:CR=1 FL=1
MKTIIKTSLLVCCALLLAGCTADEIETDKKTKTPDIPEGATLFESIAQPETRTSVGGYAPGMSLNLLWNIYDFIWVKTSSAPTGWVKGLSQNIPWSKKVASEAIFRLDERLTEESYLVRYMEGDGEGLSYDKVTIPSEQRKIGIQNAPYYFFLHGDCGVAVARKDKLTGRYKFQLEHKAAYIGIAPHSSNYSMIVRKYSPNFLVKSIKVTADQAICGTFNFNDNGIDLTSRPAATEQNKSITTSGCFIDEEHNELEDASVIVLAPGTYGTVKVEYVVNTVGHNNDPDVTVTREYKNVTFTAGKVKWMRPDFRAELCFKTYLDDRRVKKCPNVNELRWLIEKGDPHIGKFYYGSGYDPEKGITARFSRGIWIKKLSVIAKENGKTVEQLKAAAPDGANYEVKGGALKTITGLPSDLPNIMGDYIFLPALGADRGDGTFWSSTFYHTGTFTNYSYVLHFNVDRGIIEILETAHENWGEGKKHCGLWPGTVEQ